uniref:Peptidase S1 domain-containing protein n=2 Tax=Heliothis virescens TaxID=7102 RepID=A0A2A4JQ60_HELVI
MKKTTIVLVVVVVLIFIGIIILGIQISTFVNTTHTLSDRPCPHSLRLRHVISLAENRINDTLVSRFPYLAAITRNATGLWTFACFASVIMTKWVVAAAHCRLSGHSHRVIIFQDFARNKTHSFPILFWRVHEKYNMTQPNPKYDIAVARMNVEHYHTIMQPADFDENEAKEVEASVWRTVSTMDKKLYLTNHFDKYDLTITTKDKCFETYGVDLDDSLICIDTSDYDDCFTHEFGPIFSGDKVVGIIAIKPVDCEMKYSVFTNVSYYTSWILRSTYDF